MTYAGSEIALGLSNERYASYLAATLHSARLGAAKRSLAGFACVTKQRHQLTWGLILQDMPALPPDLRRALFDLPQKEKDQLLARLVAQDAVLTEQLAYRLLEGPEALETRRETLRRQVDDPVRGFHQTPNDLLVILRQLQARLAHHARITADTWGELELSLRLLTNVFRHQPAVVARLHGPTQPLLQHLVRRTQEALKQADKLHPDLHIELAPAVQEVLTGLFGSGAAPLAREAGLPRAWPAA